MAKLHSQLTGTDLHAPKGFEVETGDVKLYLSQSTNQLSSSVDIVPIGARNLGSAENPWTELFVSSASVKFVNPDTQTVLQTISATDSGIDFGTAAITASAIVDESGTTIGAPAGTVSSSAQVIYNDISNNPFTNNNSVLSASLSIIPTSAELALGSPTKPFKDIYVSSASLYVDGTQVLSSDASTITISTDANQSLKLVETGNDTITFETADGNIVLDSTGTGVIEVSTGLQVNSGNKISSDDSSNIQFANGVGITGSLDVSENVVVKGTLTAQEFNTEFVSSSIIFESGSTKFGDSVDDKHEFTGSIDLNGSIVATGTTLVSSSAQINADTITNFDTNVKAKMDADNVVSGSVDSFAVANSADNRVITSVDSSNGNAEANLTFDGSTLTVNGSIVETSAREYKDNIVSLETELPSVMKLNPVTYSWKGKEDINYGFIADEVGEIYPELLNEAQSGIQYSKMVSVLTKAIQELHELIINQEQRIKQLEQ